MYVFFSSLVPYANTPAWVFVHWDQLGPAGTSPTLSEDSTTWLVLLIASGGLSAQSGFLSQEC